MYVFRLSYFVVALTYPSKAQSSRWGLAWSGPTCPVFALLMYVHGSRVVVVVAAVATAVVDGYWIDRFYTKYIVL